jgi:group I intron endonuclease
LITGKQYIGQTTQTIISRWNQHIRDSKNSDKTMALASAIREFGVDSFKCTHIASCFDRNGLNFIETLLIQAYDTVFPNGYNLQTGGFGHPVHPITKLKISNKNKGKQKTPEHIEKIAKANRGRKQSPEVIYKRTHNQIGRKMSPEAVEKSAASRKKKKSSPERVKRAAEKHKKPIIDQNGVVYPSAREAAVIIGCHFSGISQVLKHKSRICKGYIFEYLEFSTPESVAAMLKESQRTDVAVEGSRKMSVSHKGLQMSKESIEKSAKARRKPIIDENGVVYPSAKEVAEALGCSKASVRAVLWGNQKICKGHTFKFYFPSENNIENSLPKE